MARQWTAKQAIDAQNGVTPPVSPPVAPTTPTPINTPAPVAPATITPTVAPRVEGQWNYGTADNQVLWANPTVAPTQPTLATTTVKPASASQAIAQGFKQEIKPVAKGANAPLTTEIGREAKLGQLPTVQQAQNQAEQDRINTSNLKSQSGQQLWSNLETISSANSSLLNDRNAFNKAFGYDGKDVSEKALVDAFWKSKRLDANSIYGAISTGATIPNESKNTPAFSDALIRHQDTTRFENLNPYQLSKVINTELIPWTQTYNDLMAKNPQLVTDAMKLASINTPVTARQETTNWQDNLSNYLSRSPVMSNPTTVATIMNSDPNIATKTNEVQAVEDKLTEAKDRLKNIQKNVTERYKGTGATKQTVNAKALAESQDIIDEITMLEANKASASSALTTLISNAKDNYTYARQDRQDALAQYNQGFQQLQALADMGMKQDSLAYQQQKDATERDLGLLQYYTNIDQANAKEARGYQFQNQQDIQNFDQQKILNTMGYQQQERMSSINYNQDINKLRLTNDMQTNKDLNQKVIDLRTQWFDDTEISNIIYGQPAQTQVGNLSGAELMKVLASGKLNGNKFFGVYATADMDGTDRANIYNKAENIGLDAFVNQYKGTKITPEMINIAAQKTGMDPLMIATVMAADSSMGTKWLGAKNNNPWNVGQFDRLGTQWVAGYKTLQDGVNAVAENLQKRVNALIPKLPKSQQTATWNTSDLRSKTLGLVTGGTEWERNAKVNNIVKTAKTDGISPTEAKKKLGYKSDDDITFIKNREWVMDEARKNYSTQTSQAKTALTLLAQPQTAIGDVASVVWFLKTIDPTSVARESEVQSVENARGIIDGISNVFAKAKEWTKLTDKQRQQLVDSINVIVQASNNKMSDLVWVTQEEFNQRGLDPSIIISGSMLKNLWTQWQTKSAPVDNRFSELYSQLK